MNIPIVKYLLKRYDGNMRIKNKHNYVLKAKYYNLYRSGTVFENLTLYHRTKDLVTLLTQSAAPLFENRFIKTLAQLLQEDL